MKIKQLVAFLFTLAIAPLASHAAAFDYYLEIDGIKGESSAKGHEGAINVESFSWGVSNPAVGSAGAGKATFKEFTVTKKTDTSSPKLMVACASGQHIKSAVLTVLKPNGRGGLNYLVITLEDVLVTSYQTGGNGDTVADVVGFSFYKLTM